MLRLRTQLDQIQSITFDDLLAKYHYEHRFDQTTADRIQRVFARTTPYLNVGKYPALDDTYDPYFHSEHSNIPDQVVKHDPKWCFDNMSNGRSALGIHPEIDSLVFKFYKERPTRAHPMCTSLRAPMSNLVQDAITEHSLEKLEVPRKGIVPLFSTEQIYKLDEYWVNNALVTVAERKRFFSKEKMMKTIRDFTEEEQINLAEQLVTVPATTGLGDLTWHNLEMTSKGTVVILDTEPLYGELNLIRAGIGFTRCSEMAKVFTLRNTAIRGLTQFEDSSTEFRLDKFAAIARSKIEELDA